MDFSPVLHMMPVFLLALMSPGPDFFLVTSISMRNGRKAGVWAACGIAAGIAVYAALGLLGLGAFFTAFPWLAQGIKIIGGLYLLYLAFQLLRAGFSTDDNSAHPEMTMGGRSPFWAGFMTNLTNPKALAFFTSLFAVILPHQATLATHIILFAVMVAMPILWFGLVAVCVSVPRAQTIYRRGTRWINRIAGACLGGLGVRLLFSESETG